MIKLKPLIKEDCGCGCGGCETKLNESIMDLPQGIEFGKVFTGQGRAFAKIKEETFEEAKSFKPEKRRKLKSGEVEVMKGRGSKQKWFYLKNKNDVQQLIRLGRNYGFPTGITNNNSRDKFDKKLSIEMLNLPNYKKNVAPVPDSQWDGEHQLKERNIPRSLKKSRGKQLDALVPKGRVYWVMKALKKEIRGIKISHEEVDSYTKDGLVLSKFKKDDINKIMGIVDHAGGLFENKMYKKGDVVKLLSFNRREKGKARVKGVTKARPNKFGIKNHYITNKGTFSDMEVEGTTAFKLRFKGNTEKKVMKAMGLESVKEGGPGSGRKKDGDDDKWSGIGYDSFESVNESKSDVLKSLSEIKSLIYSLYQEMSKVQKHLDPEDAQKIKKLMSKSLGDLDKSTTFIKSLSRKMESVNEASLKISQYKTSIKKLSHSQQDKLFDFLHKLKLMKLIDFINYRDGSLHIAKSSITPKIKKDIERKFKIRLKESVKEDILNEINYKQFVKYMNDFYGPKGVYPDKKKRTLKMKDIGQAYSILLNKNPNFEIGYDSTDREMLRDILVKLRKLDPDYSQKKESVKEGTGLTYKKGKTVKVKHKTSGKSLVIIDKPIVRKEYEKIGYYAESVNEGLIDIDKQMKAGTFDPKNPQVHILGYGVMSLKNLSGALSRKFADLSKRAKKGEIENVNSILNKSGVLQSFVKAYMDAKTQLNKPTMKRKITMYMRNK